MRSMLAMGIADDLVKVQFALKPVINWQYQSRNYLKNYRYFHQIKIFVFIIAVFF
jgi:hypothetical protein